MAIPLRVCLFSDSGARNNTNQGNTVGCESWGDFRTPFQQLTDLQIAAECTTWQELQQYLNTSHIDAV